MTTITMFTGKGGVGKTTCSAATALSSASAGTRTLIISTDGTPSLRHIFDVPAGEKAAADIPNLEISEIGEAEIREMWDRKFGREVYEVFSAFVDIDYEHFVEFMTSILPGLGEEFMADQSAKQRLKTITAPSSGTRRRWARPWLYWKPPPYWDSISSWRRASIPN